MDERGRSPSKKLKTPGGSPSGVRVKSSSRSLSKPRSSKKVEPSPLRKEEKPPSKEFFTGRYASEVFRIESSLGETRAGAKMFESNKGLTIVPQNWKQMVEENNLWLLAEKCMEILNVTHVLDEESVAIQVSSRQDANRFVDGLLISMQEKTIHQSNWATTSEIEKGRLEGTVRRAMHLSATSRVPWNLVRHSKSAVTPNLNYTDSLYLRLTSMIETKSHHQKIGLWITKLYNSAQVKLAKECSQKITDYVLAFDEVWASIGDTKKGADGRVKTDKAGNPKRYHPSKPDFNGMEKTEVIYLKDSLSDTWGSVSVIKELWQGNGDPSKYQHYLTSMRKIYAAQVKSVKSVKALADSRIESLGLPKTAPKSAISNRKAQRIATNDYNPVYTIQNLRLISTSSDIDLNRCLLDLNNATGDWSETVTCNMIEERIEVLLQQKKKILSELTTT